MSKCSCNHWLPTDKKLNNLSQTARVFSSKSKLKILIILLARKHCVCEIQECLAKEQSLVSHHLSDLIETGWIKQRKGKDARQVFYSLTHKGKRKLETFLSLGGEKWKSKF
jgi:DNA-binding MarR family transcriptional regulator